MFTKSQPELPHTFHNQNLLVSPNIYLESNRSPQPVALSRKTWVLGCFAGCCKGSSNGLSILKRFYPHGAFYMVSTLSPDCAPLLNLGSKLEILRAFGGVDAFLSNVQPEAAKPEVLNSAGRHRLISFYVPKAPLGYNAFHAWPCFALPLQLCVMGDIFTGLFRVVSLVITSPESSNRNNSFLPRLITPNSIP